MFTFLPGPGKIGIFECTSRDGVFGRGGVRMNEYVYRVDEGDLIVEVDRAFIDFAVRNWKPDFDPSEVLGTLLWDHLCGTELVYLCGLIFQNARSGGARGALPFRCDGPEVRRHTKLRLGAEHGGGLELRSMLLREERREPVPLLECSVDRSSRFLRMCSWCKRIDAAGSGSLPRWLEVEDAVTELGLFDEPLPAITHGLCESCYREVMVSLGR
jgi:hypothetical protein